MKIQMRRFLILTVVVSVSIGFAGCAPRTADKVSEAAGSDTTSAASAKNDYSAYEGVSEFAEMNGIFGRLTARQFSNESVSEEQIDMLLNAAFASPTGGNQRSCELMVVTDRSMMKKMQEGHPYSQPLDTAPLVIVIGVNEETAKYPEILTLDAGIAAMAIMVQAAEMGLVSVPMSIMPQAERIQGIANAIGHPGNVAGQIMVAVGHSAVDGDTHASTDYFNEEQVHVNGW
ncbi:MAG: nitroreductase family protein [Spirochaetales bacterium]|uniref:Nitroreductase family protein n=1 Tax=Candidatus Thalassospirochaeta sargassi TaxID=3119039 RepID=A0AAJ1IFA5_9SPIO|nr:nitroreductase family protein [Spirochaetales bacterium]